jgi:hypothetical protein
MKYRELILNGKVYKWGAGQDSEHPDFVLLCAQGELGVQVEISPSDRKHNHMYMKGQVELPISEKTALSIISEIERLGYLDTYFETDVGLIYTEIGKLIEN